MSPLTTFAIIMLLIFSATPMVLAIYFSITRNRNEKVWAYFSPLHHTICKNNMMTFIDNEALIIIGKNDEPLNDEEVDKAITLAQKFGFVKIKTYPYLDGVCLEIRY